MAVVRDGAVLSELALEVGRGHTEVLLGAVESVLEKAGLPLAEVDAVGVSIGPGRFSGLRVGLATAKGLAAASGVPVIPVPTLEALAESARPWEGVVCAMLDARRGEVYAALFRLGGERARERLMPDTASTARAVCERVVDMVGAEPVLFLGSGTPAGADDIASVVGEGARFPEVPVPAPSPAALAVLAESLGPPDSAETACLEPVYLRGV